MTVKELENKYKNYTIYYYGKTDWSNTAEECYKRKLTPFMFVNYTTDEDFMTREVLDFKVIEDVHSVSSFTLSDNGITHKGNTKVKGCVYVVVHK